MKQRILLTILICFSIGLAGMLWRSGDVSTQTKKAAEELEQWQRENPNKYIAFKTNTADFYRHPSKTAGEERQRLRTLHYQLQNDPDREYLMQTMERYVEWVRNTGNPTIMRELQEKPLAERVTAIQEMIRQENQNEPANMERQMIDTAALRKMLPLELQNANVTQLCGRFDEWLTTKCAETVAKLSEEQLSYLPLFCAFYRDLFALDENGLTLDVPKEEVPPDMIEKMALISLLYRFTTEPGAVDFRWSWVRFCEEEQEQLLNREQNVFEENICRFLAESGRSRQERLQRLLLVGMMEYYTEQYAKIPPNRTETLLLRGDPQKLIQLYGAYLASLQSQRRDEILRSMPEFVMNRIRGDLLSGTFFFVRGSRSFNGGRNGRNSPFFFGGGMRPFGDESIRSLPDSPPIAPPALPPMR